jgi:hypothetical protein
VLLLGLIRLVIGFIANLAILETIGIISLVIGAVLSIPRWDARLVVLVAPGALSGAGWRRCCQRVMATLRAFVFCAARPKASSAAMRLSNLNR